MNLLLAIDSSPPSDFAVQSVLARPWPEDTRVRVLSVDAITPGTPPPDVPVPTAPLGEEMTPWPAGTLATHAITLAAVETTVRRAIEQLSARGLAAEPCIREGLPGPEIIEVARLWPADLIVVGSHGYGAIKRLLLGSVASYVANHAPCSVEVVRERARG